MNTAKAYKMLILFCSALLVAGCHRQSAGQFDDRLAASLSVTALAGDDRQVVLTDLTGGFYFDDVSRRSDLGEYGYSRWNRRYLAGWEAADFNGDRMDDTLDQCLVKPHAVERRFVSGLIEIVEAPPHLSGLSISLQRQRGKGIVFRPVFDFNELGASRPVTMLSELYEGPSVQDHEGDVILVHREDGKSGWIALASSAKVRFSDNSTEIRIDHPAGESIGRGDRTYGFIPGDFQTSRQRQARFALGWGSTREGAVSTALEILTSREEWREVRRNWIDAVISGFDFRCDNRDFERAFAWARLILAGLIVEVGEDTYLMTGIPYAPYPEGWNSMLSIPGVAVLEGIPKHSVNLFRSVLNLQNTDSASTRQGMLPGRLYFDMEGSVDSAEYRVPMISGLAVLAHEKLLRHMAPDTTLLDSLATACVRDLLGTVKYRMRDGLAANESDGHFMWDSPAAPQRSGATIESQVLFGKIRNFVEDYPRVPILAPTLLPSLRESQRVGRTAGLVTKGEDHTEHLEEFRRRRKYVAGTDEMYAIPYPTKNVLAFYRSRVRSMSQLADRIPPEGSESEKQLRLVYPDTTYRAASVLAMALYFPGDSKRLDDAWTDSQDKELIGTAGLRSLSPFDSDYNAIHPYSPSAAPEGTVYNGDVLLWTAGLLGDIYMTTENYDQAAQLVEALTERVMDAGVIGALHEAENAEPNPNEDNITGNPVFATSLAEFIRLSTEGLLGIVVSRGRMVTMKPKIPPDWGNYRVETAIRGGRLWVERRSAVEWRVGQRDIYPSVGLILEIEPAPDASARHSFKLLPGEESHITFIITSHGTWKALQEEL